LSIDQTVGGGGSVGRTLWPDGRLYKAQEMKPDERHVQLIDERHPVTSAAASRG